MKNSNFIVILAGGSGTRLWPKSRQSKPKQFLKLFDNETLLQKTFSRIKQTIPKENIFVVISENFKEAVKKQIDIPSENILIEPKPAGTTSAVGLAAVHIRAKDPAAVISTIASDHYIKETDKFLSALHVSQKAADSGDYIVTMGISPNSPNTGLGYIHSGREVLIVDKQAVFKVLDFTEKPNKTTAQAYISSGEYFWNANINSYRINTIFAAFLKFTPNLFETLEKIALVIGKPEKEEVIRNLWDKLDNEPIDTAILEKANNVIMVPADFIWLDIGDWAVLHELLAENKSSNVILGDKDGTVMLNSRGTLIHTDSRLIATIGINNLIIIDTPDALLITKKENARHVKKIIDELKIRQKKELL